jgi:hypothetical protein
VTFSELSGSTGVFAFNGRALALFTSAKDRLGPSKDQRLSRKFAARSNARTSAALPPVARKNRPYKGLALK